MPYRLLLALMFIAGLPSPIDAATHHATQSVKISRAAFRPRVEVMRLGQHRWAIDHAPIGWERHALPKGVKITVASQHADSRPIEGASRS
ncbi:MAG TPA: hypothetical protein V6D47_05320 [Oscillatoriaceae cyanobacterium]